MRKTILIIFAVSILVFSLSSCGYISKLKENQEDDIDITEAEVSLLYMDPNIDMYISVKAPGWTYSKDDEAEMVVFYERKDYDGLTSFAVSSNTPREDAMTDADLEDAIDYMADVSNTNIANGISSVIWQEADPVMAGNYKARRFTYTGKLKTTGGYVAGDYLFWWTDDRLYICSFISFDGIYDEYFKILKNSLSTFMTYEEMEKEFSEDG